nr:uncharacterized protein LOC107437160 [Parasteatoda tepidariorum]XP_042911197.1 uncharacterized protein LOC122272121 [Parasteatoda tepidariorum]
MDTSLKRKHAEIETVTKRKGQFQEGAYPQHYYPIGDNFFVLSSTFKEKTAIHVRKFNRYGSLTVTEWGSLLRRNNSLYVSSMALPPPFSTSWRSILLLRMSMNMTRESFICSWQTTASTRSPMSTSAEAGASTSFR